MEIIGGAVLILGLISYVYTLSTTKSGLTAFVMAGLTIVVSIIIVACIGTLFTGNLLVGFVGIMIVLAFLMSIFEKKE